MEEDFQNEQPQAGPSRRAPHPATIPLTAEERASLEREQRRFNEEKDAEEAERPSATESERRAAVARGKKRAR